MKNKKLFKTLTISAISLATASAAIVTPVVVMANKGLLNPSKRDGTNAEYTFKSVDGNTTYTPTTEGIDLTIAEGAQFCFQAWKGGKLWNDPADGSFEVICSDDFEGEAHWSTDPNHFIECFDLSLGYIYPKAAGGSVTFKFSDTESIKFNIKTVKTDYTDLQVKWDGYDMGVMPTFAPESTGYFQLIDDSGAEPQVVTEAPADITANGIRSGMIKSVEYVADTNKYKVEFGTTVTNDNLISDNWIGVRFASGEYKIDNWANRPKINGTKTYYPEPDENKFTLGASQTKIIQLLDNQTRKPLVGGTAVTIDDPDGLFTIAPLDASSGYYKITASSTAVTTNKFGIYAIRIANYGDYLLKLTMVPKVGTQFGDGKLEVSKSAGVQTVNLTYSANGEKVAAADFNVDWVYGTAEDVFTWEKNETSGDITITPVGTGTAYLQATPVDYDAFEGSILKVVVTATNTLVVTPESLSLTVGQSKLVTITTDEEGGPAPEGDINWSYTASDFSVEQTGQANIFKVSATGDEAVGEILVTFTNSNYNKVILPVTVKAAESYDLYAPSSTPHGKVSNTFTATFTPKNKEYVGQSSDWAAEVEGTPGAVATVTNVTVTSDSKVQVTLTAGTEVGAAQLLVYNVTQYPAKEEAQGECSFYVSQNIIELKAEKTSDYITNGSQTLSVYVDGTKSQTPTDFYWQTIDPEIAEVDENGVVTYKDTSSEAYFRAMLKTDMWSQAIVRIKINEPEFKLYSSYSGTEEEVTEHTLTRTVSSTSTTTAQTEQLILRDVSTSKESADLPGTITWIGTSWVEDPVVQVSDSGLVKFCGVGTGQVFVRYQQGNYIGDVSVNYDINSWVYEFVSTQGTHPYIVTEGEEAINVPLYKAGKSSPKTLSLQRHDLGTPEPLDDFVYTVKAINDAGKETTDTPCISVNENGVVTHTGTTGKAVIKAINIDEHTEVTYAVYQVVEEQWEITGWDTADQRMSATQQLAVKLDEQDPGEEYTITWATSDTSVATITTDGVLSFLRLTKEGSEDPATVDVTATVTKDGAEVTTLKLAGISATADKVEAYNNPIIGAVGKSRSNYAKINDSTELIEGATVTWNITDATPAECATITTTGNKVLVKLNAVGSANLVMKYTARSGAQEQTISIPVTITEKPILLNYTWVEGTAGHDSVQLKAYTADGTELAKNQVEYTSSDTEMCTVVNDPNDAEHGRIHIIGAKETTSTAYITAKLVGGTDEQVQYCQVDIVDSDFKLSATEFDYKEGDPHKCAKLTAYYNGAEVTANSWSLGEGSGGAVEVDASGNLTYSGYNCDEDSSVVKPAIVKATYQTIDGKEFEASCKIYVWKSKLSLNVPSTIRGQTTEGKNTRQLEFFVDGREWKLDSGKIAGYDITFAVVDQPAEEENQIVTVNATGLITMKKKGTATVRVTWHGQTIDITVMVFK